MIWARMGFTNADNSQVAPMKSVIHVGTSLFAARILRLLIRLMVVAILASNLSCERAIHFGTVCSLVEVTVTPGACSTLSLTTGSPPRSVCGGGIFSHNHDIKIYSLPTGVSARLGGLFETKVCADENVRKFDPSRATYSITYSERVAIFALFWPREIVSGSGELEITTTLGVTASANSTVVPAGGSTQLNAVIGGGTPTSIAWTADQANAGISNPAIANPGASPSQSTNYTVTVADANSTASDSVRVCVSDLNLSVAATPNPINFGETSQLEATVTGSTGVPGVSWDPAGLLDNAAIMNPIASPRSTTNFTATVVDDEGCPLSETVAVSVFSPLNLAITATPDTINIGEASQLQVDLTGGVPPYTYSWDPVSSPEGLLILNGPIEGPVADPAQSTVFSLTVRDNSGAMASSTVTVHIAMSVSVAAFPASPVPPFTIITLEPTVSGGAEPYSYVWAPAPGLDPSDAFQRSPRVAPPPGDTTYIVNVTDAVGQTVQGSVTVNVTGGAPQPEADLELSKTTAAGIVQRGELIDFNLFVFNDGPSEATGTAVTDILPQHLTFSSLSLPFCSASGSTVSCDFGTIPSQQGATNILFTFVGQCAPEGTIINTATVGSIEDDPDPNNNSATAVLSVDFPPVTGAADRWVTVTGPSIPVSPGEIISFNVLVGNNGPDDANASIVTDNLHPNLIFEPDFSTCTESNRVPACCLTILTPNSSANLTLFYEVHASTQPGTIVYTVNVTGDETDTMPGNDSDSWTITVQ